MNRFEIRRTDKDADLGGSEEHWDLAVPVIDGVPLSDRMWDREIGTWAGLVALPSLHWLGRPDPDHVDHLGRAEVLTGTCGDSGCCGVFARIVLTETSIRWEGFEGRGSAPVPDGLGFEFDRAEYESALAGFGIDPPIA